MSAMATLARMMLFSMTLLSPTRTPAHFRYNEACVLVAKDASAIKRLSYVTRRVWLLQELQAHGVVDIRNVPGKDNPADALTKSLDRAPFRRYMARLYNADPSVF